MEAERIIEAILFAASRPVSIEEIIKAGVKKKDVEKAMESLKRAYSKSAIEIVEVEGKYVMQLKNEYAEYARKFAPMEMSRGMLKTLAIIAYHQPIKQSELKNMIGGQIYEYVRELKNRGFIKTKKDGRTKIIETTPYFHEYFGLGDEKKLKKILYAKVTEEKKKG